MVAAAQNNADGLLVRRKVPKQQRAKTTVESILQATEELVRLRGFANVNTRMIAERAGVNIGSLYQYFPSYESILLSWYERVAGQVADKMRPAILKVTHDDLDNSVPYTTRLLLTAMETNELVLVRMVDEMPEIARATRSISFESLVRSGIRMYLNQHPGLKATDIDYHAFFLESIIFSSIRRYISDKSHGLSRTKFIQHLSRTQIAYMNAQ